MNARHEIPMWRRNLQKYAKRENKYWNKGEYLHKTVYRPRQILISKLIYNKIRLSERLLGCWVTQKHDINYYVRIMAA